MSPILTLLVLTCFFLGTLMPSGRAQTPNDESRKTFIDYFLPMPLQSPLSKTIWGSSEVGPRDGSNGLEDANAAQWFYWDGQIIKGPDGKFNIFASRWDRSKGFSGWKNSKAVHAISNNLFGPYIDQGLCWPNDHEGKGHNVTALALPDGRYAVIVSDTRPGDVFTSKSLDGPWDYQGSVKTVSGPGAAPFGRTKNLSLMVRPDGSFEMVPESGVIAISKTGVLGPYIVQGSSAYRQAQATGLPWPKSGNFEDPAVWYSGGIYHIIVNSWAERKAYHLTSVDGISNWKFKGLAYDPSTNFIRYTDGTVNHWHKLERAGVYLEDGHVVAMTFAVLDIPKEKILGDSPHGSKIIVVPFDGAGLDRDLSIKNQ